MVPPRPTIQDINLPLQSHFLLRVTFHVSRAHFRPCCHRNLFTFVHMTHTLKSPEHANVKPSFPQACAHASAPASAHEL